MGEILEPAFEPAWVGRARRRGEPTPAFDAYQACVGSPALDPNLITAWQSSPHVSVPPGRRPLPAVSVQALLDEVGRLTAIVTAFGPVLERALTAEACRFDYELRYPLTKVGVDAFLAWVGSCDAPAGWVMTEAEALVRGWSAARIAAADEPNPDGYLHNRAGPGEKSLTPAAVRLAYASADAHNAFRLTVAHLQCYRTSGREDPVTGEWDDTTTFWVPWDPAHVPDVLPPRWNDRF